MVYCRWNLNLISTSTWSWRLGQWLGLATALVSHLRETVNACSRRETCHNNHRCKPPIITALMYYISIYLTHFIFQLNSLNSNINFQSFHLTRLFHFWSCGGKISTAEERPFNNPRVMSYICHRMSTFKKSK